MYYIYHIPERKKIGATDDVTRRMREHKWTGFYEILEEHTCIYKVSDREIELQKQYGYEVDNRLYWQVRKMSSKSNSRKGGLNTPQEQFSKMARMSNKLKRKLTYEQAEYIRAQYKRGKDVFGKKISYQRLANTFDVDKAAIIQIVKNRTYTTP